jgi:hypothetical protein
MNGFCYLDKVGKKLWVFSQQEKDWYCCIIDIAPRKEKSE